MLIFKGLLWTADQVFDILHILSCQLTAVIEINLFKKDKIEFYLIYIFTFIKSFFLKVYIIY